MLNDTKIYQKILCKGRNYLINYLTDALDRNKSGHGLEFLINSLYLTYLTHYYTTQQQDIMAIIKTTLEHEDYQELIPVMFQEGRRFYFGRHYRDYKEMMITFIFMELIKDLDDFVRSERTYDMLYTLIFNRNFKELTEDELEQGGDSL